MQFNPNAIRAANLFFCISDLSIIDPMYQFSLEFFVSLFKRAIDETPKLKGEERTILFLLIYTYFY